jgi:hypothetical protein
MMTTHLESVIKEEVCEEDTEDVDDGHESGTDNEEMGKEQMPGDALRCDEIKKMITLLGHPHAWTPVLGISKCNMYFDVRSGTSNRLLLRPIIVSK